MNALASNPGWLLLREAVRTVIPEGARVSGLASAAALAVHGTLLASNTDGRLCRGAETVRLANEALHASSTGWVHHRETAGAGGAAEGVWAHDVEGLAVAGCTCRGCCAGVWGVSDRVWRVCATYGASPAGFGSVASGGFGSTRLPLSWGSVAGGTTVTGALPAAPPPATAAALDPERRNEVGGGSSAPAVRCGTGGVCENFTGEGPPATRAAVEGTAAGTFGVAAAGNGG